MTRLLDRHPINLGSIHGGGKSGTPSLVSNWQRELFPWGTATEAWYLPLRMHGGLLLPYTVSWRCLLNHWDNFVFIRNSLVKYSTRMVKLRN
jgi:hypothetical protein